MKVMTHGAASQPASQSQIDQPRAARTIDRSECLLVAVDRFNQNETCCAIVNRGSAVLSTRFRVPCANFKRKAAGRFCRSCWRERREEFPIYLDNRSPSGCFRARMAVLSASPIRANSMQMPTSKRSYLCANLVSSPRSAVDRFNDRGVSATEPRPSNVPLLCNPRVMAQSAICAVSRDLFFSL